MAIATRRRRGEAAGTVKLFADVAPEAKEVVDRIHEATGAAKWAIIEAILLRTELDDRGRPTWWPVEDERQARLPLSDIPQREHHAAPEKLTA
jgi:hypothetical protein